MVFSLASGSGLEDAFRCGIASGSAALLTGGTELSRREDTERLLADVTLHAI
jgi:6-phosphofructokinase 2